MNLISYQVTNSMKISTLFLGSFVPTTSTLTSEQTRDKCLLKLSTSKGVKKVLATAYYIPPGRSILY